MSFLFRKVEDVTTISKSQSLTSVSIKDCTWRVPNNTTTLFFTSNNKSNLRSLKRQGWGFTLGNEESSNGRKAFDACSKSWNESAQSLLCGLAARSLVVIRSPEILKNYAVISDMPLFEAILLVGGPRRKSNGVKERRGG